MRVTGYIPAQQVTTAGLSIGHIRESTTTLNRDFLTVAASDFFTLYPVAILTPSAGSHTYKLSLETSAGTVETEPVATGPAFILVEDIGPA